MMEPLFTTTTVVSREEYKKMSVCHWKKNFRDTIIAAVIIFVCALVILCCREYLVGALFGVVSVLIIATGFYGSYIMPERYYKKSEALVDGMEQTINFYEKNFEMIYKSGTFTVSYDEIYKITETDTNFYIYKTRNEIVNVIKENCTEELVWFLRGKKCEH